MADTKISALTDVTTLEAGDKFAVADLSDLTATKSGTLTELIAYLQTLGMPMVRRLNSQHSIASATATKVTDLDMTLEPGTYEYQYSLILRTATAADGPQLGINFSTGTAAVKTMVMRWADATASLLAEVHSMDNVGVKTYGFISGMAHNAYSTTSPNMGTTVGCSTTASDIPAFITGVVVVTVQGNLELWHGCEGTNASSVEIGSALVVRRTA